MPSAGSQIRVRLRRLLAEEEHDPERREQLFAGFAAPRAALINRRTRIILDFLAQEADALRGARVLDYGCGSIPFERAFAHVGSELVGADIGANPRARVRLAEDGTLPEKDATFDYVFSCQVLEHVPDPNRYLNEAYRVLKTGGKLFLATHGTWPYHPSPGDYRRWTRAGLRMELEGAGFDVLTMRHVLNEYSAAIQAFAICGEYHRAWRGFSRAVHLLTRLLIGVCERGGRYLPQIPAVLCAVCAARGLADRPDPRCPA